MKASAMLAQVDGGRSSAQKEIALLPTRSSSATPNPDEPPKRSEGSWQPSMYTHRLPFCIPKRVPAVAHPRSARTHFRKSLASEDAVPFGFCSGGFSSTSSLRSGQRGSTEVERRSLPARPIISSRAPSRFYPRGSDESADSSCASLSASAGASVAATFTASCCPQATRCRIARRSPCRSRLP